MGDKNSSHENLTRRTFLAGGASTGLGIALSGSVGSVFGASPARGAAPTATAGTEPGYGPLIPDPGGLLALPAGFSYKLVGADVLMLESQFDGKHIRGRYRRMDDSRFRLISRGFHWINEWPYNR